MKNKNPKRQLANRLLSTKERSQNTELYRSHNWLLRLAYKKAGSIRILKRVTIRRLERELAKEQGKPVKYSIQ